MVKAQFLMTPMIRDAINHVANKEDLREDEVEMYSPGKQGCFDLLSPGGKAKDHTDNIQVFPGRCSIDQLKLVPPCVICFGELDFLRRDCEEFIPMLKAAGKYLDHQNMPGGVHGYWSCIEMAETVMFYNETGAAFKKYVVGA